MRLFKELKYNNNCEYGICEKTKEILIHTINYYSYRSMFLFFVLWSAKPTDLMET